MFQAGHKLISIYLKYDESWMNITYFFNMTISHRSNIFQQIFTKLCFLSFMIICKYGFFSVKGNGFPSYFNLSSSDVDFFFK